MSAMSGSVGLFNKKSNMRSVLTVGAEKCLLSQLEVSVADF